jgi:CO/xanthine dehydrogenase FAD-binding subunit
MVVYHRRLPKFEVIAPRTLKEAVQLLTQYGAKARILAGGTDLLPKLKARDIGPLEALIDLRKVPDLNYIEYDGGRGGRIGALTTLRSIETSVVLKNKYSLLTQAAGSVGSLQVRNRGTLAGNICNAVPSADMAPSLLVLEAEVRLTGPRGQRSVKIGDFFSGPNQTAIDIGEIVTEIRIPEPPARAKGVYLKLSPRAAMDLAVVGVAALVAVESGICKDVRLALGAVAPTPIRARSAEKILMGQKVSPELIEKTAREAAAQSRPIDDHRASAEYRREMVGTLTARAINLALTN